MFSFAHPELIILVFLPLLMKLLPASRKAKEASAPEVIHPYIQRLQVAFGGSNKFRQRKSKFISFLFFMIWMGFVFAIMQPQNVSKLTKIESHGYDLMLAVDLSGSMKALDFSSEDKMINRLDVTKHVVSQFVKEREGDRVGLVLFGDTAHLYAPLTLDTEAIGDMLNNTEIGMAGDTTAIGDAIGVAVKNLRERPEGSRVIILLTDGENTAGSIPPLEAAELAKKYGIRIYTIGIGSNGQVPFPDQFGRIVYTTMALDEDLLQQVAKITSGSYFNATDSAGLKAIYDKINKLEKTKAETKEYVIRDPLYQYPLGFAIALLLLLALTPIVVRREYGF